MVQVQLNNNSIVTVPNKVLGGIFVEEDVNESEIIPLTFVDSDTFMLLVENYDEDNNRINISSLDILRIIDILNIATALHLENIMNQIMDFLVAFFNDKDELDRHKLYKDLILNKIRNLQPGLQHELYDKIDSNVFVKQYSIDIDDPFIISSDKTIIITYNSSKIRTYANGVYEWESDYSPVIKDAIVTNNGNILHVYSSSNDNNYLIMNGSTELISLSDVNNVVISNNGLMYTYVKDNKRIFRSIGNNEIIQEFENTNNVIFNFIDSRISPNMNIMYNIFESRLIFVSNIQSSVYPYTSVHKTPDYKYIKLFRISTNNMITIPLKVNSTNEFYFSPNENYLLITERMGISSTYYYYVYDTNTGNIICSFHTKSLDNEQMIVWVEIDDNGVYMSMGIDGYYVPFEYINNSIIDSNTRLISLPTQYDDSSDDYLLMKIDSGENNNVLYSNEGYEEEHIIIYKRISGDLFTLLDAKLS